MADPDTTTLDARIAAALQTTLPAVDVRDIIAGARQRLRRTEELLAAAEREALDPRTPSSKARAARDRIGDLTFNKQRTLTSIAALEKRVEELESEETEQSEAAAHAAIVARRDDLAARLKERVPALLDELAGLLAEVRALDAQLPAGVMSAEAAARGCPGNFYWPSGAGSGPVSRLTAMKLPCFYRGGNIWPIEQRAAIDFGPSRAQSLDAARKDRERQAKDEADRLAAHPWRSVRISGLNGYRRFAVGTMNGECDVDSDCTYHLRMSDAQAKAAKAKGATVELVAEKDVPANLRAR